MSCSIPSLISLSLIPCTIHDHARAPFWSWTRLRHTVCTRDTHAGHDGIWPWGMPRDTTCPQTGYAPLLAVGYGRGIYLAPTCEDGLVVRPAYPTGYPTRYPTVYPTPYPATYPTLPGTHIPSAGLTHLRYRCTVGHIGSTEPDDMEE